MTIDAVKAFPLVTDDNVLDTSMEGPKRTGMADFRGFVVFGGLQFLRHLMAQPSLQEP